MVDRGNGLYTTLVAKIYGFFTIRYGMGTETKRSQGPISLQMIPQEALLSAFFTMYACADNPGLKSSPTNSSTKRCFFFISPTSLGLTEPFNR